MEVERDAKQVVSDDWGSWFGDEGSGADESGERTIDYGFLADFSK
jgi:hypothetical protein